MRPIALDRWSPLRVFTVKLWRYEGGWMWVVLKKERVLQKNKQEQWSTAMVKERERNWRGMRNRCEPRVYRRSSKDNEIIFRLQNKQWHKLSADMWRSENIINIRTYRGSRRRIKLSHGFKSSSEITKENSNNNHRSICYWLTFRQTRTVRILRLTVLHLETL